MNDIPKLQSVLKPLRCQNVFDDLRGELVLGSSPEGGKSKLCIGVYCRLFENAFPWMEELAYEWVIEAHRYSALSVKMGIGAQMYRLSCSFR